MSEIDDKHEWVQGKLLVTKITRSWSKDEFERQDYVERCMAFVNFFEEDQGKSRKLVFRGKTPEECKAVILEHNRQVKLKKKKQKKGEQNERD